MNQKQLNRLIREHLKWQKGDSHEVLILENIFINDLYFSNADLSHCELHNVTFENCDFTGVDFSNSNLSYVNFKDSCLDYTNFIGTSRANMLYIDDRCSIKFAVGNGKHLISANIKGKHVVSTESLITIDHIQLVNYNNEVRNTDEHECEQFIKDNNVVLKQLNMVK